jgi:phosphonate transport system substrate-binding protein
MRKTIFNCIRVLSIALAAGAASHALAQKGAQTNGSDAKGRLVLAINEGAAGSMTATDIVFRYAQFKQIVEKAVGAPVTLVGVRDARMLRKSVQTGAFTLVLSRPADVLAEAVRDYGYQAVVVSQEPAHALFIVKKDSPLKTIGDVKGKSILTPDRYAYMWRIASAMMRDNKILMAKEQVRAMSDQAAIGWSMEGGFFDVGVVASFSGVGRTWEKNGGRVIARSPELPNTPMIASSKVTQAQIQKLRTALVALRTSESGAAVLKDVGVPGFKEASSQTLIELITWLGDLDIPKDQ